MIPTRLASGLSFLAACAIACVVACQGAPTAPATTAPPTSAGGHKMGLDVNNANSVGVHVTEMPIVTYTIPADVTNAVTSDGGSNVYTTYTVTAPTLAISEIVIGGIGPGPNPIALSSCYLEPQAALTASNTNYATLDVYKRPGDGGASTLLASASTVITQSDAGSDGAATGNWVAYSNLQLTMASAGAFVSPGDQVTFVDSKTGAGVALPQTKLHCYPKAQ